MRLKTFNEQLLDETPEHMRCEHLRSDDIGPYCGKNLEGNKPVSGMRRDICDHISLQLYCLDKDRKVKCIYYQGEPIREDVE